MTTPITTSPFSEADKHMRMNSERIAQRQVDELVGMVRMALSDGALAVDEVEFITRWMDSAVHVKSTWPGDLIYNHLTSALEHGEGLEAAESTVLGLLNQFIGAVEIIDPREPVTTRLPFTSPPPIIEYNCRSFCLTGRFRYGTRDDCSRLIQHLGGTIDPRVTRRLDYLIIGATGSGDWRHSSYGTKIMKAVDLNRNDKGKIAIVSEDHWMNSFDA